MAMGITTTFLHNKNNGLQQSKHSLLLDNCMDAEGVG